MSFCYFCYVKVDFNWGFFGFTKVMEQMVLNSFCVVIKMVCSVLVPCFFFKKDVTSCLDIQATL